MSNIAKQAADLSPNRVYLTKRQLCAATGLSPATIQRYKDAKKIPFYQPHGKGGSVRYPPDAIEAALRQHGPEDRQKPECVEDAPDSKAGREAGTPGAPRARLPGPRPRWMSTRCGDQR